MRVFDANNVRVFVFNDEGCRAKVKLKGRERIDLTTKGRGRMAMQ